MIPYGAAATRQLTVADLRDALADLPDTLPVELLVDVALASEATADPAAYDVDLAAPLYDVQRTATTVELRVDWRAAG